MDIVKFVCVIMFLSIFIDNWIVLFLEIWGNKGYWFGFKLFKLNLEWFDVINVWNCLFVDNLIFLLGNFFIILIKNCLGSIIEFVFEILIIFLLFIVLGIVIFIEILEFELVNIILCFFVLILILVNIGNVVFGEIVFNVLFNCVIK